jgi:hypothetical protein
MVLHPGRDTTDKRPPCHTRVTSLRVASGMEASLDGVPRGRVTSSINEESLSFVTLCLV